MSDVIISRRGQQQRKSVLITEYITENQNWTMPEYAANNEVSVRIFGGGGGGYPCGGGGSGWMNNDVITLTPGEEVPITIGLGGNPNGWSADVGGVTSFGTYLSANGGGNQSKGGAGGYSANKMRYESTAYQFGGGSGGYQGGNGGPWGGGGIGYNISGSGGIYGGGAGGAIDPDESIITAGNGGKYGGGGGGPSIDTYWSDSWRYYNNGGIGGTYGGNGGSGTLHSKTWNYLLNNRSTPAENGTNTLSYTNIAIDEINNIMMNGPGLAGAYDGNMRIFGKYMNGDSYYRNEYPMGSGGGGYGGNGGRGGVWGAGGGGGYGSNGGSSWRLYTGTDYDSANGLMAKLYSAGGGGYGGDGEDGEYQSFAGGSTSVGAGGGGYGKVSVGRGGAGGGYYCPGGGKNNTRGGGGVGVWKNGSLLRSYASGGWYPLNIRGESGVCIIQYYI